IGVRGTIVAGQVDGMHSFVALMGPGDGNNAGANQGSIVLSNVVNGQTVEETVNRTGYGSVIEGEGSAPSSAFQVPAEQMNSLVSNFSPGPSDQGSGASGSGGNSGSSSSDISVGSVSAAGGENTFAALGTVNDLATLEETISSIGNETDPARQNDALPPDTSSGSDSSSPGTGGGPGSPDVTYTYSATQSLMTQYWTGSFDFYLEVNGTDQTINGYVKSNRDPPNNDPCIFDDGSPVGAPQLGFEYNFPQRTFDQLTDGTDLTLGPGYITDMDISELPSGQTNTGNVTIAFSSKPIDGTPATVNFNLIVTASAGVVSESGTIPVTT
ncbi:MAG: hypothetical protein PHS88_10120, partial [Candidatus Omnitrophica bacterium]|nr:hypothetical protein [Candidatus Omnitrophota bacterium]